MFIVKISAVAILVTIVSILLGKSKPELSMLVTVAGGIIIVFMILAQFTGVLNWFNLLADKTKLDKSIVSLLLKIVGIGYIAEFASTACEDAGNKSMAEKVVLAAKIIILALSIPIFSNLIDVIVSLL